MDWTQLEAALTHRLGRNFQLQERRPLSGGCINESWHLATSAGPFFLKLNRPQCADMFAAEWDGLEALRHSGTIRVPAPIARGVDGGASWLLLEHIDFGTDSPASAARFGEQLAALHRHGFGDSGGGPRKKAPFGFHRDNYIGSNPQANVPSASWCEFFRDRRLGAQRDLARQRGASAALLDAVGRVMEDIDELLGDSQPAPSLLHGDLWGGNCGTDREGKPVLFDPAVYRGDREADIAMTELFGGLPAPFYEAYSESWPLPPGYPLRRTLYNLYHILNHFNLFGGHYGQQALQMCRELQSSL